MGDVAVHVEYDDRWARRGGTHVRGCAFRDDELLRAPDLAALFDAADAQAFGSIVDDLNGFFAIVRADGSTLRAAVDHIRSIPLFYATTAGRVAVSDDAQWLAGRLDDPRYDRLAEAELAVAGLVSGSDTLVPEVKQLQAGERVRLDAGGRSITCERDRRFDYRPDPPGGASGATLERELSATVDRAFERLVAVAGGRPIAVSLSGGTDSRLVASALAATGYDEVVAFTFGRPDSPEIEAARSIADALDLPCETVEYTPVTWRRWFDSDRRSAYYRRAFNFDALPSIGGWRAVGELERSGRIPSNAIVVSGDAVTSTQEHVPETLAAGQSMDESGFVEVIRDLQYDLWAVEGTPFRERIAERWPGGVQRGSAAAAAIEAWDWRERQAKFIVSGDEYADWGFDWWLPLFDRELATFWQRVPLELRLDRRLHRDHAGARFAERTGTARGEIPTADRTGVVDRAKATVASSPAGPLAQDLYDRVASGGGRPDPLAVYGIVPEALRQQTDRDRSIHAFKALELLGRVSFVPPVAGSLPADGTLSVVADRDAPWPDRVDSLDWFNP